jgi:threonine dehydrogenase-like Zn-dependent dehydrogenase
VDPSRGAVHHQVQQRLGCRADVGFDAVGVSGSLADALEATAPGGTVCLVGMGQPRIELDAYAVSTAERALVGSFTYSADDFRAAVDVVAGAADTVDTLISRVVPLREGPAAFSALARGDGTPGKVLVRLEEPR